MGEGHHLNSNKSFVLINVYGPSMPEEKVEVWNTTLGVMNREKPKEMIVGGDFNAILNHKEKVGGLVRNSKAMLDLGEFVPNSLLCDIEPNNGRFTWTNKREGSSKISEMLDRFLVSKGLVGSDLSISSSIFPYLASDHFPIPLKINLPNRNMKGYFKFQSMWWRDSSVVDNLEQWWKDSDQFKGTLSFWFSCRLNFIKNNLKEWNISQFENIFVEKAQIEEELERLNERVIVCRMGDS
ncbi:hypothetical protein SUGI_0641290 [Cryptomeria japonica]|nr:hypothetical protein SUGI_0641290 [Cryptomeria japonica]